MTSGSDRTAPGFHPVAAGAPRRVDVERRRSLAGSGRSSALRVGRAAGRRRRRARRRRRRGVVVRPRARPAHRRDHRRTSAASTCGSTRGCVSATPASGRATPAPRSRSAGREPSSRATGPRGTRPTTRSLARVLVAIDDIGDAHDRGTVLVVVHGGVVRALERHFGEDRHGLLPNLGGRWLVARRRRRRRLVARRAGAAPRGRRGHHARADLRRLARGRPAGA